MTVPSTNPKLLRIRQVFFGELRNEFAQADRVFALLMVAQWIFCMACALLVSPYTWSGPHSQVHLHLWLAIGLGGLLASLPCYLAYRHPGEAAARWTVASAQALFSALIIHLMGGRIEAHFHVFGSLALLAFYRDPKVFIPAVGVTVVDHLMRGIFWPESVYGVTAATPWRTIEHGCWVLFETAFLLWGITQSRKHLWNMARLQVSLACERDELELRVQERTAELAEARDYFSTALDSLDANICVLDRHGTIISTNAAWKQFAEENNGFGNHFGPGINYLDVCNRATGECRPDALNVANAIRSVLSGKSSGETLDYSCHSETEQRWFQARVSTFAESSHAAAVVSHVNITERVLAHRSVAEAANRVQSLARIIDEAPNEIYILDPEVRRFVRVSDGVCNALGYSREEMLTMTPFDIQNERTEEDLREIIDLLWSRERQVVEVTTTHITKSGEEYPALISLHTAEIDDRPMLVAFGTNLSESQRLEKQLAQAQKLESLGQLAAGISHEINTPMQCVSSNVEFLNSVFEQIATIAEECNRELTERRERRPQGEPEISTWKDEHCQYFLEQSREALGETSQAASRVIEIVGAMKAMSHPGTKQRVETDVNDILRQSTVITRNKWKYVARTDLQLDESLPTIQAYPAELSQVFINMLVNAADALAESERSSDASGVIFLRTYAHGDGIVIEIEDNGPGIPEHVRQRIFDMFFTTKDVGKGTGQGLAIAHDVVVGKHGGEIDVDSKPGEGTCFRIMLPVVEVDCRAEAALPASTNS